MKGTLKKKEEEKDNGDRMTLQQFYKVCNDLVYLLYNYYYSRYERCTVAATLYFSLGSH